jgi:hypothetical protein
VRGVIIAYVRRRVSLPGVVRFPVNYTTREGAFPSGHEVVPRSQHKDSLNESQTMPSHPGLAGCSNMMKRA